MDNALIETGAGCGAGRIAPKQSSSFRDFLNVLLRRRWIISGTALVGLMLALLFASLATPRYTAMVELAFDATSGPGNDIEAMLLSRPIDEAYILSQVQVIPSRGLVGKVVDQLGLVYDSEFNRRLQPRSTIGQAVHDAMSVVGLASSHDEKPTEQLARQLTVDEALQNLVVKNLPRSRIVQVTFTSLSSQTAANFVNALADQFLSSQLESKFERAQRTSSWLASKVQSLRDSVERSESNVEDYRRKHNLLEGERATLVAQEISELNSKFTDASMARTAAEAQLAQARKLVATDNLTTMMQVLDSTLIQRYREQELDLERKESEMLEQFGPRHPLMIQLKAEKVVFRRKLQDEIGKILGRLENDVEIARKREAAVMADLNLLKQELAVSNSAAVGLRTLQRDAEAHRLLLDKFMNALTQTTVQQDANAQQASADIVSRAEPPLRPSFPRKLPIALVGLTGSLVLGILFAYGAEALDTCFRSAEQLEQELGVPVVGHVPMVRSRELGRGSLSDYVVQHPDSAFVEAIRSVHRALMLRSGPAAPRSILFTSAQPGEGKTTIALSLACIEARAGQDVIFVDGDIRRSPVAGRLGLRTEPGLIDLLAGRARLEDVIQTESKSGARIIVAGRFTSEAADLIDSARFAECLQEITANCELVVLDSPPLNAISDAHVFGSEADATVLVVGWGKTKKEVVRYASHTLVTSHIIIKGLVLSRINISRLSEYTYGDASHYTGKAKKYYHTSA